MNTEELAVRTACVMKMMAAFGVTDEDRLTAMVEMTSGIPFRVPKSRGNKDAGELLFARAVVKAGMSVTFGAPTPGDIMEAAVSIAGHSRSDQGHTAPRRWVTEALGRNPEKSLGLKTGTLDKVLNTYDEIEHAIDAARASGMVIKLEERDATKS